MKWTKVEISTTCEAVDLMYIMLDDLGIEGIQIEDNVPITEEEKVAMQEIDEIIKSAGLKLKIPSNVKKLAGKIGRGIDRIDTNNTRSIENAINATKRKDIKSILYYKHTERLLLIRSGLFFIETQ